MRGQMFTYHNPAQDVPLGHWGDCSDKTKFYVRSWHDRWNAERREAAYAIFGTGDMAWADKGRNPEMLKKIGELIAGPLVIGVEMRGHTNVSSGYPVWSFDIWATPISDSGRPSDSPLTPGANPP